jgi:Fic family protein
MAAKGHYPHLAFAKRWELSSGVQYQLGQCDAIIAAISAMPIQPEYREKLLGVSLVKGALSTTAIEGNTLTEAEVELVAGGKKLPPSKEYQEIEVGNVLGAMNVILREVVERNRTSLVTPELIKRFHALVGADLGEHFDAVPGRFRSDERVVGSYRCPRHEDVPMLIERLCEWLQQEFGYRDGTQTFADAVVQAIVTHVYLEWIHPFGDGNGRTGRLLEFYVLLRAGNPDIASHVLSNFYNATRPEYYRQLQVCQRNNDVSSFIAYAVTGYRDGLLESLRTIQENNFVLAWRTLIHDRFAERRYRKKTVFKRRRELMLSIPIDRELSLPEMALTSPQVARSYAGLSDRTLLRDVQVLVEMGLLERRQDKYAAKSDVLLQQMATRRNASLAGGGSRGR